MACGTFATREEAEAKVRDLMMRWLAIRASSKAMIP
jgi:hypothetical protein